MNRVPLYPTVAAPYTTPRPPPPGGSIPRWARAGFWLGLAALVAGFGLTWWGVEHEAGRAAMGGIVVLTAGSLLFPASVFREAAALSVCSCGRRTPAPGMRCEKCEGLERR